MVEAFDAQQWVLRMGKELERVACDADPCFFPRNAPPPWGATKEQIREHEKRQYRDLACAARHDETAAKLFAKSSLGLNADHQDARSALREHPLLGPGLTDCGGMEAAGPRRSAGSFVPVRLAPPADKPGSPVGGFSDRRPGLNLEPLLPLQSEDLRVEDLPRENTQRVLPRAIPTSRNPPYVWRRTVQRSRTTRLGPMAWREIH